MEPKTSNSESINKSDVCIACGNNHGNLIHQAEEKMFGMKDEFRYLECNHCSSLQIIDIPDNLSPYYPTNYYAFGGIVPSGKSKNIIKKLRWALVEKGNINLKEPAYLDWMKRLGAGKNDRIADIGCGNGQLVYELKCSGFRKLWGFDPYLQNEVKEKGFNLLKKNIGEIEGTFDLVMMHHSFEHMENPKAVFQKLSQIIPETGKLLIRVPITDGLAWKNEGINWFQLDAPRHLFIPSIKALNLISKAYGFDLKEVIYDSSGNQFWGPIIYKKGLSFLKTNLNEEFSEKELALFEEEAKALNKSKQGDQACFYFEKK